MVFEERSVIPVTNSIGPTPPRVPRVRIERFPYATPAFQTEKYFLARRLLDFLRAILSVRWDYLSPSELSVTIAVNSRFVHFVLHYPREYLHQRIYRFMIAYSIGDILQFLEDRLHQSPDCLVCLLKLRGDPIEKHSEKQKTAQIDEEQC
jgi:hypothetical protein